MYLGIAQDGPGRSIRTFNVIDDFNREGLAIDVDLSLPSARVIRSLKQLIEWRGKPSAIRCDNGPEYISKALRASNDPHHWENKAAERSGAALFFPSECACYDKLLQKTI